MNRLIIAAIGLLALSTVAQERQPSFDPEAYAASRARAQEATPEPVGPLRKTSPAIVPVGENPVSEALSLRQAVEAFRAGWNGTDPAGAPPVRWVAAGAASSPERIGSSFTAAQIQRISRAVAGAPIEDQVLVWKLYGANQHQWRELQRLRAIEWPPPNDDPPPGREDDPPGDGNDGGGEDPPTGEAILRINCGGPALGTWSADAHFSGGGTFSSDRIPGGVYATERFGAPVAYRIPLAAGRYTVRLHFSELFWNQTGGRVFDVRIEGAEVLDDFSPAPTVPAAREFEVDVSGGFLDIVATPSKDNASLCGIEVIR